MSRLAGAANGITRHAAILVILLAACSRGEKPPTPPPSGPPAKEINLGKAPVLLAAGDIAICGKQGDERTGQLVDSVIVADSIAGLQSVVLTIGDNAYPSGKGGVDNDFPRCFAPSWGSQRILKLIHPTIGNHEYDSGSPDPYFEYFGAKAGAPGKGYYSFDLAGWHFVALNSELYYLNDDRGLREQQETWLKQDLATHKAQCTLAYWHRPQFSSGIYGLNTQMRRLWEILYDANADVIINGHEHHYERFLRQNPSGDRDPAHGIEEIIVGTGGGTLRGLQDHPAANSVTRIRGHFGILKLSLGNGEYSSAFIDGDGRVWDPASGKCH